MYTRRRRRAPAAPATAPSSRDTASGGSPGSATIELRDLCGRGWRRRPARGRSDTADAARYDRAHSPRCASTTPPAIDQELSRLAAVLRPLDLLQDVLMPVLTQVGDDWHRGRTRIAHEHLMSSTMRNLLGAFLRLYARREASVRLAVCDALGRAPRDRDAGRGDARGQRGAGRRVSRRRSARARNRRQRRARRRTGCWCSA